MSAAEELLGLRCVSVTLRREVPNESVTAESGQLLLVCSLITVHY